MRLYIQLRWHFDGIQLERTIIVLHVFRRLLPACLVWDVLPHLSPQSLVAVKIIFAYI